MRIENKNLTDNYGTIKAVPESSDDLWHLEWVIGEGDKVSSITERKIEGPSEVERSSNIRETMSVELDVESVELDDFSSRLRISGIIKNCDRESEIGRHHTINIEPRKELEIEKKWKGRELERLEEAKGEPTEVVVVSVEEGECYIHKVGRHNVNEIAHFKESTGKGEGVKRQDLFERIISVLKNLGDIDGIILAGPGFTKKDVYDYIEENEPGIVNEIIIEDTASIGGRGVHEVLKRGAIDRIAEEIRIEKQASFIDELLERVARGGDAIYGQNEVKKAANQGAIEVLLVVEEHFRESEEVQEIVDVTEQKGGDVIFFPIQFDPGQQLEGLGGIAALLRYKI